MVDQGKDLAGTVIAPGSVLVYRPDSHRAMNRCAQVLGEKVVGPSFRRPMVLGTRDPAGVSERVLDLRFLF